jgi:hypothetical protein
VIRVSHHCRFPLSLALARAQIGDLPNSLVDGNNVQVTVNNGVPEDDTADTTCFSEERKRKTS